MVTSNFVPYRIRGLVPNCSYRMGLKSCKSNSHVERTIPAMKAIKVCIILLRQGVSLEFPFFESSLFKFFILDPIVILNWIQLQNQF